MDVDSCYIDQCYNIKLDGATVNMLLSLFWTLHFSPLPLRSAMYKWSTVHFLFSLCKSTVCVQFSDL